jgi:hypothetical protein
MTKDTSKDIDQLFAEGTAIDEAIGRAVREALLHHKRNQRPIVIDQDGTVVWVQPEDIDVLDDRS